MQYLHVGKQRPRHRDQFSNRAYVLIQIGPGQIIFYCSDELELFAKNGRYNRLLPEKLRSMLKRGKGLQNGAAHQLPGRRCCPCLRSLAIEHLTGRIQSFYTDLIAAHMINIIGLNGFIRPGI